MKQINAIPKIDDTKRIRHVELNQSDVHHRYYCTTIQSSKFRSSFIKHIGTEGRAEMSSIDCVGEGKIENNFGKIR